MSNEKWVRNPIDRFVLAHLDREGLKPSAEANRTTLLRRLSFDLTGLPPSTAEIDRFLADKSPDAYEKQVDRLLAQPQYGERMAMQWLDLARYADTHGFHIDSHRDMWRWRDWVIAAFNRNMPFNQFGIEQLAGDLLPNATVEQRLATGFNRNHMINYEGGAIPEEYQVEYVADRVDTTANVFMGLTVGCARCHDHKFDPIPQRDYYRFFAFFNTVAEKGLDGRAGNAAPILEIPTAAQASDIAWLQQSIAEHEAALPEKDTKALVDAWQKTAAPAEAPRGGLLAHYSLDGDLSGGRLAKGAVTFGAGRPGQSATFNGEAQVEFPSFDAPRFAVAMWVRSGPLLETTWLEGGPGFEIGVEGFASAARPQARLAALFRVPRQAVAQRGDCVRRTVAACGCECREGRAVTGPRRQGRANGARGKRCAARGRAAHHRRPAQGEAVQGRDRRAARL